MRLGGDSKDGVSTLNEGLGSEVLSSGNNSGGQMEGNAQVNNPDSSESNSDAINDDGSSGDYQTDFASGSDLDTYDYLNEYLNEYPVSKSYTAYTEAKSNVVSKIIDALSEDSDTAFSAFELSGVVMIDIVMLPVYYFSMGQEAASAGLSYMDATNVKYSEEGNKYVISYNDSENAVWIYEGYFDEAADSLTCKATKDGEDAIYADYHKTKYGYAGQYYLINDDGNTSVYKVSVQGEDGYLGISNEDEYSPLNGDEAYDFQIDCEQWYSVSGDKVIGISAGGTKVDLTLDS
jgi:hypothetical protein